MQETQGLQNLEFGSKISTECAQTCSKVNFILEQVMKAQRGTRGTTVHFLITSTLDGGGWSRPRPGQAYNMGI
jgi:hypothetical protein